jgi:hypothetical protein
VSAKKRVPDAQNLLRAFQRSGDVPRGGSPVESKVETGNDSGAGRKVNVALDEALHLEVKLLATRRRMTVQALVNVALRAYIDQHVNE